MSYVVFHCKECGWRSDPAEGGMGMAPQCPDCFSQIYFTAFEESELELANRAILPSEPMTLPKRTESE
jgi:hypothetical protein